MSASQAERRYGFDQHMLMIYVLLVVVSCLLGGVGGLGLATTMSLNLLERRRELAVLRAIGATRRAVWLIVVAEGVLIAVLSGALAALLAWPASRAVGDLMAGLLLGSRLDFHAEPVGIVVTLAASAALGAAASFLPAWHGSRAPIAEAIAYE